MKPAPLDLPAMPDAALLDLLLGLPDAGRRVLPAEDLPVLARLSPVALAERAEVALQAATRLAAAFELGRRLHAARSRRAQRLWRPRDVARFFHATLAPLVHEEVWIAALDVRLPDRCQPLYPRNISQSSHPLLPRHRPRTAGIRHRTFLCKSPSHQNIPGQPSSFHR